MGVVRQLVNKSAGRSAFVGKLSPSAQGAITITSFTGPPLLCRPPAPPPTPNPPPEPAKVPPLPAGEDATEGARPPAPPALLAGDGAAMPPKPLYCLE